MGACRVFADLAGFGGIVGDHCPDVFLVEHVPVEEVILYPLFFLGLLLLFLFQFQLSLFFLFPAVLEEQTLSVVLDNFEVVQLIFCNQFRT